MLLRRADTARLAAPGMLAERPLTLSACEEQLEGRPSLPPICGGNE
jgi:hypothetical protein